MKLPEDDIDVSKHVECTLYVENIVRYIYIYMCVCVCALVGCIKNSRLSMLENRMLRKIFGH